MKKQVVLFFSLAVVLFSFTSCKKAIQDAQEQEITNAITNGTWYVLKFTEGGVDKTTDYTGWDAIYYDNGTFRMAKTGETPLTGTWAGNAADWTFTITYNSTPPSPLEKLGGVWTVTRAVSTDKGSYSKTVAGVVYELEMKKRP